MNALCRGSKSSITFSKQIPPYTCHQNRLLFSQYRILWLQILVYSLINNVFRRLQQLLIEWEFYHLQNLTADSYFFCQTEVLVVLTVELSTFKGENHCSAGLILTYNHSRKFSWLTKSGLRPWSSCQFCINSVSFLMAEHATEWSI